MMKTLGVVFSNIHDKDIAELTANRTLASVPFGGRYRLIDFVLSNMVNSGITKVGVITKMNYQSLMDHVGSGKSWDLSRKNGGLMVLPPYGVGSQEPYHSRFQALKNITTFLKRSDEEYVAMSDCDNVCNFDFSEAVRYHIDKHADITVVVRSQEISALVAKSRTVIETDLEGRVTQVLNTAKATGKQLIYTNMMIVNRKFLISMLDDSEELGYDSFSRDVLVKGAKEYRIFALEHTGYFACIESLTDYYRHSLELLNKDKRDMLFKQGGAIYTKVRDSAPARLSELSNVSGSMIADGCVIEGEVTGSILFRGVKIAKGAVIRDSIILQDTYVGPGSTLNCVIADKQARILERRMLSGHETHPYFIAKNCVI